MKNTTANIAYMRISSEGQSEGQGLAQQRQDIIAWAVTRKVVIDEWFEEVETGTKEDREVIQCLLARARNGEKFRLVLDRVNRLGRDTAVTLRLKAAFEDAGSEVVFVQQEFTDDPAGKLMFTIFAGLADYDRAEWLKRMSSAKRAAVRNKGTYKGGPAPFGYRSVGAGKLAIESSTAALVRLCFRLTDAGATYRAVVKAMNDAGHDGASLSLVHRILKRRDAYEARVPFGNDSKVTGGRVAHPPILEV